MVSFYRVPVSTPKTTATPTHCLLTPPALLMAGHPKGNPTAVVRAGLSSLPLPFSGTCTLLDHGLQKHPATLLHQCQAPCVCWVTDHSQTELRAAPRRVSLCWCSHTIIGCSDSLFHLPEEADPISRVFWWAKALPTAKVHEQAGNNNNKKREQVWSFFLDAKHSPWGMDFGTCGVLTRWLPSLQLTPRAAGRGVRQRAATHRLWADCLAPGGHTLSTNTHQQPGLATSLPARQHRTFALPVVNHE